MSSVSKHAYYTPLETYKLNVGDYPSTEEGLEALINVPVGKGGLWKGPYVKPEVFDKIVDPWGSRLLHFYPSKTSQSQYQLISLRPDRVISEDDLTIDELIAQMDKSDHKSTPKETMFFLGGIFLGILVLFQ